ncbi:GntR family transcriptional regulator [Sporolactobacillus putidus]|uniref:GntR family transcriptional regulator n=2 Tax=Sporolactobacillus putidus TaxID=492735 RepID=A0A917RZM4_9BACL|nr:GntR family transcriptional regulator [Sporolactobacillus putidus]
MQFPPLWMKGASLGERIANVLRLRIVSGEIKPGSILSENKIAKDFGTSRSPVRDAMKALSADGLINLERMGAVVLGLDLKDIQELYDVRYLIESFAQQRIPEQNLENLVLTLNQIVDQMELALKYQNQSEFAYQDLTFHETIIIKTNHMRILNLWNGLRHLVMAVILVTTEEVFSHGDDHVEWVIEKHRKIIRGLQTKQQAAIEKSVQEYFSDSKQTLNKAFPPSE